MKTFRAEDTERLIYVSWPAIRSDGRYSACVKYRGDRETGTFPSGIWLIDNETGEGRCLTEDGHSEKQPVFSRDGGTLFFLSDASGAWQVWSRDLTGGAARQLTTLRHGVERYAVSGSGIAFEAVLWPEEIADGTCYSEMSPEEKRKWEEEQDWRPYIATELTYKMDEWYGMRKGEVSRIGYQSPDGGDARILPTDGMEGSYPSWSHDGSRIAFQGYPYDGPKGRQTALFVWDIAEGKLTQVPGQLLFSTDHAPLWTADDAGLIAAAYPANDDYSTILMPYLICPETGESRLLLDDSDDSAKHICHGVHPMMLGRSEYGADAPYMALDGSGEHLYFQSFHKGLGGVYRVPLTDPAGVGQVLACEDIFEFALADCGEIVCTAGNYYEPPELYYRGRKLTDSNSWLREYSLGQVETGWTKSRDGEADLQYWIVTPPDFDPERKYPAVLDAKGGPETCYGSAFWHEFQALASEGIVVVYGNPRGSAGYGRKFNADIVCWKDPAMIDHLTILDAAAEKGFIDTDRLGVTGGSYGGYMTMKLIGRTDTFTAAVAQRALANPVTSYGTGDMGFVSAGGVPENFHMIDELNDRARGNIISYVDQMKTPLLILHAARDYRCGFEQAEQIFISMHERNPEIPLRMVRFEWENHGLTRIGRIANQIRHLSELVIWFRRYLIEEPWRRVHTGAAYGMLFEQAGSQDRQA